MGLVGSHTASTIGGRRIDTMSMEIGLGAGHEEGACLMQPVQAAKIDIPSIHDVDGTSLGYQHVKRVNIVQLAVRDMDKARNVAAQIELCVHLHRRFRRSEMGPWEHRQPKIDGGRIQRVDGFLQVQPKVFTGIQLPRLDNQFCAKAA
jgi:hypothetical protein